MELSVNQDNSRARIQVTGDVDEAGAEKLKSSFKSLNLQTVKEVTIDFGKVNHIGSAGIGKLLVLYKDLAAAGGSIRIENLSADIYELFLVLKLDSLLALSGRN